MKIVIKFFLLMMPATLLLTNCTNFGTLKEFNGIQLYYTKNVTESEATSLGLYLSSSGFADGQNKTVQLDRTGNTYEVRMVVKKGIELDPQYCEDAKKFGADISYIVFNSQKVDVHFCDKGLNTLRVMPMAQ
jgi:hypothetical protein